MIWSRCYYKSSAASMLKVCATKTRQDTTLQLKALFYKTIIGPPLLLSLTVKFDFIKIIQNKVDLVKFTQFNNTHFDKFQTSCIF